MRPALATLALDSILDAMGEQVMVYPTGVGEGVPTTGVVSFRDQMIELDDRAMVDSQVPHVLLKETDPPLQDGLSRILARDVVYRVIHVREDEQEGRDCMLQCVN